MQNKPSKSVDTIRGHTNPVFLARISVNYLRHMLTSYEDELTRIYGKTGVREAYLELNEKIYEAIGDTYEEVWWELVEECDRQYRAKCDEADAPTQGCIDLRRSRDVE